MKGTKKKHMNYLLSINRNTWFTHDFPQAPFFLELVAAKGFPEGPPATDDHAGALRRAEAAGVGTEPGVILAGYGSYGSIPINGGFHQWGYQKMEGL